MPDAYDPRNDFYLWIDPLDLPSESVVMFIDLVFGWQVVELM